MAAAAKNIIPCSLELGGKSPAIMWKDVNVEQVRLSKIYLKNNDLSVCK